MSDSRSESSSSEKADFKAWVGVWGTMLSAFMAVLDIQITNASLRYITGGISATEDEGSWIPTLRVLPKAETKESRDSCDGDDCGRTALSP